MPLRSWKCKECKEEFTTKANNPAHCGHPALPVITAPGTKFMEKIDQEHGKSQMVDQQRILKQRARDYSRDHETHDLVAMNDAKTAKDNGWVKENGQIRKKIDDL